MESANINNLKGKRGIMTKDDESQSDKSEEDSFEFQQKEQPHVGISIP